MTDTHSKSFGTPSPDVLVAHLAGEAVLLNLADKRYYRLNESAAFIWKALERGEDRDQTLASVVREFEVDPVVAAKQTETVVNELRLRGLLAG